MVDAPRSHVLVADDDTETCDALREYLGRNEFRVSVAHSGEQAIAILQSEVIDLLVLETQMRGADGPWLTGMLREASVTPIVVLSSRDDIADKVMGLELGADDYVTKPFSSRELVARIRAVLRRYRIGGSSQPAAASIRAFRFDGWELNLGLSRLTTPERAHITISRGECTLLRAFLSQPQRILTRDQLLALTRVNSADVYDRAIDVQILRLRRKIERDATHPRLIRTERGAGYYFDATVDAVPDVNAAPGLRRACAGSSVTPGPDRAGTSSMRGPCEPYAGFT